MPKAKKFTAAIAAAILVFSAIGMTAAAGSTSAGSAVFGAAALHSASYDLSEAVVTVDTSLKTVKVTVGNEVITEDNYTVTFEGVDVDYIGETFPADHGTYKAKISAAGDAGTVYGSTEKEFTIESEDTRLNVADARIYLEPGLHILYLYNGEEQIPEDEYTVVYEGVDVDYKGFDFPRDAGKYTATVTANEDSEVITGSTTVDFTCEGRMDLSEAIITVNNDDETVTVALGEYVVPERWYTIEFVGEDNNYRGFEFPTDDGSYRVIISAGDDNEFFVGSAELEFTVDAGVESMGSGDIEEPETGVWRFSSIASDNLSETEKNIFDDAMHGLAGAAYEPVDVIATQTVAGMNLAYLCKVTPAVLDPVPHWAIVTVYAKLDYTADLVGIKDIDIADVKTVENIDDIPDGDGAGSVEAQENNAALPEGVVSAFEKYAGVKLDPIAILGTQVVAGTNFRLLAYGTPTVQNPRTYLYVVDVYEDVNGNAEISNVALFDLLAYVSEDQPQELDDSDTDTPESETDSEAGTVESTPDSKKEEPAPVSSSKAEEAKKSDNPKTGTIALGIGALTLAGAAVLITTKRDDNNEEE